jgi:uncharacterized protein
VAALDQLADEKYVLLTTFRKDGRAVPTPVWVARDGAELAVWTAADSGKVKRIRRSGRVTLAPCDVRGRPRGPAVPGHARVGDAADRERLGRLVGRKYGVLGRLTMWGSRIRRGTTGTVAVLVRLD